MLSLIVLTIVNIKYSLSISFENIANNLEIGLSYSRSYGDEWNNIIQPFLAGGEKPDSIPLMRQHPGLAIFDYDNDGDLDIFITNGPGKHHSLFKNKFIEIGELKFEDVAIMAGFGDEISINHDGSGVCFGDIDNNNNHDILILGRNNLNLLYKNNGDGTFNLIENSGISQNTKQLHSTSCSFGDINNDGFIDVVIANAADTTDIVSISGISTIRKNKGDDPYQYNQFNELYINNNGDGTFNDISDRITETIFDSSKNDYNGIYNGKPTITWSIEMVDINQDGHIDIIHADDNLGTLPTNGGYPKGCIHIFLNDGNKPIPSFSDTPTTTFGLFMGNSAADINCDGHLDLFLSDMGGIMPSRWYFGEGDGTFNPTTTNRDYSSIENIENIFVSPFGWGNAIFDYDNDGDLDILYHGGGEMMEGIDANNPGVIFENIDGCFNEWTVPPPKQLFDIDPTCLDTNNVPIPECTIHVRRNVRGVAIGDLNLDGFNDIVTSSDQYFGTDFPPPHIPTVSSFTMTKNPYFQDYNFYFPSYINRRTGKPEKWKPSSGDLAVEISDAFNDNNYFHVLIKGSKGILECGNVNRDAIGTLLNVNDVTIPIEGGSSHISQHSLQKIFGMGSKQTVNLLIKYPCKNGGYIVNKLNNIAAKENLILYEIPCDYNSKTEENLNEYIQCVEESLCKLNKDKYINNELMNRLYNSALNTIDNQIQCNSERSQFCNNGKAFKI